mmetsp:Transcript_29091/g.61123  ORF Transcript_29091/g.61123 Transcript_29091/m.61123 type:complete len:308 (+) Transcript_29091:113-1036(+)
MFKVCSKAAFLPAASRILESKKVLGHRLAAMSGGKLGVRSTAASGATVYESERAVHEYLQMHFATPSEILPYACGPENALGFPERCAEILVAASKKVGSYSGDSALDVGCAVGGATFSLAKHFACVDGIDFSLAFIDAARQLQKQGSMDYKSLVEGTRFKDQTAVAPKGLSLDRCTFTQGDACDMEALRESGVLRSSGYEAVLASNLLCRLPRPRAFLRSCAEWAVAERGVLLLVTPFSWLEEYTPLSEWIGGGDEVSSEALSKEMNALGFQLLSREEVPFLIREHARKYQWGVSEATCWMKGKSGV